MAVSVTAEDLTDVDREILDVLQTGPATTGMLVDETGRSRTHVSNRLEVLHAYGYVTYRHERTALHDLAEDPREE